jgi:hypothetical protein
MTRTGSSSILWAAMFASLGGVGTSGAAHAQSESPGDERAQLHFRAASTYYNEGDYEDALREFQSAYDHSHRSELLWNLYLCHERLGHFEQALASLQSFVEAGHPGFERGPLDTRIENLRRRVLERQSEELDESAVVQQPEPVAVPEPEHQPDPVRRDTTPYLAIAGFSVAAVGLVTFAVFGSLALVEDQSLWNECGASCSASRTSDLQTFAIVADVGAGVAAAGAILGVVGLVIAPWGSSESVARVSFGPGGVSLAGSF